MPAWSAALGARSFSGGWTRSRFRFEQENGTPWPMSLAPAGNRRAHRGFARPAARRRQRRAGGCRWDVRRAGVGDAVRRVPDRPIPRCRWRFRETARSASPIAKKARPTGSRSDTCATGAERERPEREPIRERSEREPGLSVRERLARDRAERDGGPAHHEGIPMARDRDRDRTDRDRETSPVPISRERSRDHEPIPSYRERPEREAPFPARDRDRDRDREFGPPVRPERPAPASLCRCSRGIPR